MQASFLNKNLRKASTASPKKLRQPSKRLLFYTFNSEGVHYLQVKKQVIFLSVTLLFSVLYNREQCFTCFICLHWPSSGALYKAKMFLIFEYCLIFSMLLFMMPCTLIMIRHVDVQMETVGKIHKTALLLTSCPCFIYAICFISALDSQSELY